MIKITVIDDDPDSRNLLRVLLRSNDFNVNIYPNAEEFLRDEFHHTDLYIIDINLGGVSGTDICDRIKKDPSLKSRPVIIISAHPEIEKLSQQACADDFLSKPFSRKELMDRIRALRSH